MNPSVTAHPLLEVRPRRAHPTLTRIFDAYQWLAQHEPLACAFVVLLTLGIRAALLPWFPEPVPRVHDEFSYLLGADTFASGRVTNPPHPMWRHFETFHELMQPTYSSRYPIAQALTLAFGQRFFGDPWIGVFLATGLLCGVLCWMLQGWVAPDLALLGGLLAALHIGIFDYWMNSYWGGSVAAIGGALGLGAMVRIWRRHEAVHWVTLAIALAILMHSRPFEGAVLGAEMLGLLAWAWRKFPAEFKRQSWRALIPASGVILLSLGVMAYDDYRVTGNALSMPHELYYKQHPMAPSFLFLSLHPPSPTDYFIRGGSDWEVSKWQESRHDPLGSFMRNLGDTYNFFFGLWPLLVPPLVWPYRLRTPEERATVGLLAVFLLLAMAPITITFAHYEAPITALLYARFMQTIARLNAWRPTGRPIGPAVTVFLVTLFLHQFVTNAVVAIKGGMRGSEFSQTRAAIARQLGDMPGKQLVMVRYTPKSTQFEEWVWNRADIDASQTVWARELGGDKDRDLLDYYRGRNVWLLDADRYPVKLVPYFAAP